MDARMGGSPGQRHEKQALFDMLVGRADRFQVIADETEASLNFHSNPRCWTRTCLFCHHR